MKRNFAGFLLILMLVAAYAYAAELATGGTYQVRGGVPIFRDTSLLQRFMQHSGEAQRAHLREVIARGDATISPTPVTVTVEQLQGQWIQVRPAADAGTLGWVRADWLDKMP